MGNIHDKIKSLLVEANDHYDNNEFNTGLEYYNQAKILTKDLPPINDLTIKELFERLDLLNVMFGSCGKITQSSEAKFKECTNWYQQFMNLHRIFYQAMNHLCNNKRTDILGEKYDDVCKLIGKYSELNEVLYNDESF